MMSTRPDEKLAHLPEGQLIAQAGGAPNSAIHIAMDRYPLFAQFLPLFNDAERGRLVRLAEAEICPCDGSLESLDSCLKKDDGGCLLAVRLGKLAMRGIKEGEGDAVITEVMVQEVQEAKKVHRFSVGKTAFKGAAPDAATVTIIEFADFACGYCGLASDVAAQVVAAHPERVSLSFKQFPLHAPIAARAVVAAQQQGKFWEMHDLLFDNQRELEREHIFTYAKQLGLDAEKFAADLDDKTLAMQVAAERAEGVEAGVRGTPSFFINGIHFPGSYEDLPAAVERMLAAE